MLAQSRTWEEVSESGHLLVRVKGSPMAQHAPADAGDLVGQSRRELGLVQAQRGLFQPRAEAELAPVVRAHDQHLGGLDEQGAQVTIAPFGDAPQDRSASGAVLPWHQPKPGAKVAPSLEGVALA